MTTTDTVRVRAMLTSGATAWSGIRRAALKADRLVLMGLFVCAAACGTANVIGYKTGLLQTPPRLLPHQHGNSAEYRDRFSQDMTPALTASGCGGATITLQLHDASTGLPVSFPDQMAGVPSAQYIQEGHVAEFVLTGLGEGSYSARLYVAGELAHTCEFTVE
ncbi:MAG: hypothetical protein HKN91_12410 [Acidimicrobiia bacterium]|nr:hypothetical protein [Acidimicrobiia bacterium]